MISIKSNIKTVRAMAGFAIVSICVFSTPLMAQDNHLEMSSKLYIDAYKDFLRGRENSFAHHLRKRLATLCIDRSNAYSGFMIDEQLRNQLLKITETDPSDVIKLGLTPINEALYQQLLGLVSDRTLSITKAREIFFPQKLNLFNALLRGQENTIQKFVDFDDCHQGDIPALCKSVANTDMYDPNDPLYRCIK